MKINNTYFLILLTTLSIGFPLQSFSKGGNVGNGGAGIICSNTAYLYDLFEASIPGEHSEEALVIDRSDEAFEKQIDSALAKLQQWSSPSLRNIVEQVYKTARSEVKPVPSDISLVVPTDLNSEFMKKGCVVQGLASYNDEKNRLSIDMELYSKMGETDKAALWIHEAIYKVWRKHFEAEDSRFVRKLVGFLFSDKTVSQYPKLFKGNMDIVFPDYAKQSRRMDLQINLEIQNFFFIRINMKANCAIITKVVAENIGLYSYSKKPVYIMDGPDKFDGLVLQVGEIGKLLLPENFANGPVALSVTPNYKISNQFCDGYELEIFDASLSLIGKIDLSKEQLPWIYNAL